MNAACEFLVGTQIGFILDHGVGHGVVAGRYAYGTIALVTDKALQVRFVRKLRGGDEQEDTIWVPKAGLRDPVDNLLYQLAPWWRRKMDGHVWSVLERHAEISGVSARM